MDRIPWPTENLHQEALDLLGKVEIALGLDVDTTGATPTDVAAATEPEPAAADQSEADTTPAPVIPPATPPRDEDVEAKAKELLASGWTPPTSPEVTGSPETTNAFAGGTPPGTGAGS